MHFVLLTALTKSKDAELRAWITFQGAVEGCYCFEKPTETMELGFSRVVFAVHGVSKDGLPIALAAIHIAWKRWRENPRAPSGQNAPTWSQVNRRTTQINVSAGLTAARAAGIKPSRSQFILELHTCPDLLFAFQPYSKKISSLA